MNDKSNPINPILIVDDELSILLAIDTTLQLSGFNNIITCQDSREVNHILQNKNVELILLDLNMPHVDGETLLDRIHQEYPDIPVIIVTGVVDVDTAVHCMKVGAFDYIVKPVEEGRLLATVNRALDFLELKRENLALKQRILKEDLENPEAFKDIITKDKKMFSIFQYIESIAGSSQPVLIQGETGVGKELIARAVHRLSRPKGNFVAVNVAGLDDNVFSDTLFGHVKGAFTGADRDRSGLIEKASSGTLFLDEIGDLSSSSQVKLLRLLQEREYFPLGLDEPRKTNARIVASTLADLKSLEHAGKFRKDLNYRLSIHQIHMPPLKERKQDIRLLTDHFLKLAAAELGKKPPTPPEELYTLLSTYCFPGNIRELQSMVFDAVSRHKSKVLSMDVFKAHIHREQESRNPRKIVKDPENSYPIAITGDFPTIKEVTLWLISEAMNRSDGNQSIAAGMLGISQQALSKRLKK
ncbi:MAG: sigma-54 dependent transcriptional regulator [Desulfobacterales bacterium]|jgi:DNA-binding NtrC family response regulator|nr:sigma-54 dependent transcriptional regulator [Desulfobacterales bacterium]